MTPTEYRRILKRNKISQSWVGRTFASHGATGRRWAVSGCTNAGAQIVLRLIDKKKITKRDIEVAAGADD